MPHSHVIYSNPLREIASYEWSNQQPVPYKGPKINNKTSSSADTVLYVMNGDHKPVSMQAIRALIERLEAADVSVTGMYDTNAAFRNAELPDPEPEGAVIYIESDHSARARLVLDQLLLRNRTIKQNSGPGPSH